MQIVGYETAVGGDTTEPALQLASDGTVTREPLSPGRELSYTLGERHCAGVVDGDDHTACQRERAPYCDRHTSRWPCAQCTGDCEMPLATCHEEHAIYLAAFAPATFKVGVTRSWRLETRLREQGADRAAHLQTVDNGRIARQIESTIASEVGDSVRVSRKVRGLHRTVDDDRWNALLRDFDPLATDSFDYGLDLEEQPLAETLATGVVRGTQGRVLVLDNADSTYAVDLRDLVGHEVTPEETDRRLQSSLGAFD